MGLFNDTVTIYQKSGGSWSRTIVEGVQWSDVTDKSLMTGRLTSSKSANITFPEEVLDQINLTSFTEEDAIFFGALEDEVTTVKGSRLSDLLAAHPKSGIIRSVNDNSNRDLLKNIKVVVY